MKAVRIVTVLLLFAAVSAAYVWLRPSSETPFAPEPIGMLDEQQTNVRAEEPLTNNLLLEASEPVQPLEERGDAMLFEIDALQNTPFDEAIVQPFE